MLKDVPFRSAGCLLFVALLVFFAFFYFIKGHILKTFLWLFSGDIKIKLAPFTIAFVQISVLIPDISPGKKWTIQVWSLYACRSVSLGLLGVTTHLISCLLPVEDHAAYVNTIVLKISLTFYRRIRWILLPRSDEL